MNRAAINMILLMLCCSCLMGQQVIIQSNNMMDYEYMGKDVYEKLGTLPDRLRTVISQNPDYSNGSVIIQITYFDPYTIGNMKLKTQHVHTANYIQTWKNAYAQEDRILFLFEKQASGSYSFIDFVVTNKLSSDGQLPDIVTDYIKTQILEKEQDNLDNLLFKGINAVKNAFDRRFIEQMSVLADEFIKDKKYYKGYVYAGISYFGFKVEKNPEPKPYNFCELYSQKIDKEMGLLYEESGMITQTVLANVLAGKYVRNPKIEPSIIQLQESDLYVQSEENYVKVIETGFPRKGYLFTDTNTIVDKSAKKVMDIIVQNPYRFVRWDQKKVGNSWIRDCVFSDNEWYCDQQYRVRLVTGTFSSGDTVNTWNGLSNWVDFRLAQPTWCNQFARDLSNGMYRAFLEKGTIEVLKDERSKYMYNSFIQGTDKFRSLESIKNDDEDKIWNSFVDKGYLVFYSFPGHIDTCLPNWIKKRNYRNRYSGDSRYPDENEKTDNSQKNIFIGAGESVGYRNQNKWKIKATPYIYLEYLNHEFK